jgi:hypothetical protein
MERQIQKGRGEESNQNAYEFAGRLLVPPDALREAFQTAIQSAQADGYSDWRAPREDALDYEQPEIELC